MKRLVHKHGAGCRNRTCFVSLKRRVHSRICQSRKLLWVTLCSIARKSGARRGPRWNRTSLVSLTPVSESERCCARTFARQSGLPRSLEQKRRVHQLSLPATHKLFGRRGGNRTHMNLIRNQVPDPFSHTPSYKLGEPMRAPIKREQLARAQQSWLRALI